MYSVDKINVFSSSLIDLKILEPYKIPKIDIIIPTIIAKSSDWQYMLLAFFIFFHQLNLLLY